MIVATAKPADDVQEGTADQIAALRKDMLRFARLQLRSAAAAEDMVQDAIEAALRNVHSFGRRATLKTWVFAILRNRIIDHLRAASRTVSLTTLLGDPEDEGWDERAERLFDAGGSWGGEARPSPWPNPEQWMQQREFWQVFDGCLQHLPANTARVFVMRECLGFEADEICARLEISSGNCHVILHRARLKLRDCMEKDWGRPGEQAG